MTEWVASALRLAATNAIGDVWLSKKLKYHSFQCQFSNWPIHPFSIFQPSPYLCWREYASIHPFNQLYIQRTPALWHLTAFNMDLGGSILNVVYLRVFQMTQKAKEPLHNTQKEYAMLCSDFKWLLNQAITTGPTLKYCTSPRCPS